MDKRLFSSLLFFFFFLGFGYAQTNVSGNIISNTTWTKANSPYVLTGNVGIPTGLSLTIEPGVTIQRTDDYQILINGAINANGAATDSIVFRSGNTISSTNSFFIEFQKSNLSLST